MRSKKINFKNSLLAVSAAMAVLSACNKAPEEIGVIPTPTIPTSASLAEVLSTTADDTLFYKLVVRGGMNTLLNDKSKTFTVFSPTNAAMRQFISAASGGLIPPSGAPESVYVNFINTSFPASSAAASVAYLVVPQKVPAASFGSGFANYPYPTTLNPMPAASPFLRLDAYLSRRSNGAWLNNVPVIAADRSAGNGVIHSIAAFNAVPQQMLWDRINTDPELTFLKAAIQRADSGVAVSSTASLEYVLKTSTIAPALNITLFAPTDAVFQATIYAMAYPLVYGQLYQAAYAAAIAGGATAAQADAQATAYATANAPAQTTALSSSPTVFQNPMLFPYFSAQTVKGIVVYHMLFGSRAFTPNIPATATAVPTMLNSAIPAHPGLTIAASFTGPVVTSATVKGVGNATAANVTINPLPGGSSDQHYVNGVLHKINQVLFPQ